jgi:hypothetical protein
MDQNGEKQYQTNGCCFLSKPGAIFFQQIQEYPRTLIMCGNSPLNKVVISPEHGGLNKPSRGFHPNFLV